MRVEYNSNQINTLLDKGLLPIPSVDLSVDNGAMERDQYLSFFNNIKEIQNNIDSGSVFIVDLKYLKFVAPSLVLKYAKEWKRRCDEMNAPYDDLTNFKVVEIKQRRMFPKQVSLTVKLNTGKKETITESFNVQKKKLGGLVLMNNNVEFTDNSDKETVNDFLKHCSLPVKLLNVIEKTPWGYSLKDNSNYNEKINKEISNKKLNYNAYNQCPCCENDTYFLYDVSDKIGFDVAVCDKCNFNSMVI